MKRILWIVNVPLNPVSIFLSGKPSNGVWIEALLEGFKDNGDFKLIIATTANVKKTEKLYENGVLYYILPDSFPTAGYNENKPSNIKAWKNLLGDEKPDLIQIWGTEFTHGLCALRQAKDIPSVIYMQGYVGSIARHYLAGMTDAELRSSVTFRNILKQDSILKQQKRYYVQQEKEKEMFCLSGRIISENEWCSMSVKAICPQIEVYNCPLSVNHIFSEHSWDIEKAEKHSIICNASGYPLKGLHMMLRAAALLKNKYPDLKLYVPGTKVASDGSLKGYIKKQGYTKYIEKLIKKLGVEENIVWLGNLTQDKLASCYERARAFVLCSSIENHSSSLKEAMMVGTPCVASSVGGVPEYVRHGENGFLYRFEEYEIMAGYVERIFEDDKLSQSLSEAGRHDMMKLHGANSDTEIITDIYNRILGE